MTAQEIAQAYADQLAKVIVPVPATSNPLSNLI